ncbi:flagellar basal-body MS-ring/collar protein FliF [Roseomonas xinghualingensis]|uniref:flagellar basal-body MS-ring/collar protein FliF n=1 Tax=Roseomonas xinghualingensis TaxID=2986475 RepID=UPI0021F0C097|nr:flagellar basal-body MS-ring/collar protein FliF [Roseomonas sp. SXEYE001]MCV4207517.1 flagellar basal-body MS-ring/collar protein FliF [Roseomonas sp. SXEYE001]
MAGFLAQLRALGALRLGAMAAVALAVLGLLGWFGMRAGQPGMALLYAELDPRDAGAVVAALDRQKVAYHLGHGGTSIMVPEEMVPRLRLSLAREGLPAGGSVGWEIFDRGESLTTTPFQQDVNRLRAMEGELSRTIRGLAGVRAARVHLVLPRREAFSRQQAEAQASVVLTMQGIQRLDREGVQAVLHLVATAVPGLQARNVSIVDSRGELLARGGQALNGPAAAATQEEMRRAEGLRIARAVEEMLERSLGPGRVRAEAAVEMDFDRIQTTEERFDPENQVARSVQSSQEQSRGAESGNVSVANQLPGAEPAGGNSSQENKSEETTNYEIGKTVRSTLREHPVLRRLSVAVLVDGVWEGTPPSFRERSADELARIGTLVRSAIGFDERRGDRVEVVSMRFALPEGGDNAPEAGLLGLGIGPATLARLVESAIYAVVALIAILLVARPMAKRLTAALVPQPALAGIGPDGPALPGAGMAGAIAGPGAVAGALAAPAARLPGEDEMVSLDNVQGQLRASSVARVNALMEAHPDEALTVMRRWLAPEEN